jgi:hypothetical protein
MRHIHTQSGAAGSSDLRNAEVEHLDAETSIGSFDTEKVRRFEIAVDDAKRVRLDHDFAGLKGDLDRIFDCHLRPLACPRTEVFSL